MLVKSQRVQKLSDVQRIVRQVSADLDIFLHGQVADEVVKLENIAEMLAAVARQPFFAEILQFVAADGDVAGIGAVASRR